MISLARQRLTNTCGSSLRRMCTSGEKAAPVIKESKAKTTWQTYLLRSTVVVIGMPVAVGAAFLYNLKSDEEFRFHFEEKYPDLIETIRQYVELEDPEASATQGGQRKYRPPSNVVAIVTMKSGRRFRLHLSSTASTDEVTAAAQKHGAAQDDSVVDIVFEDSEEPSTETENEDATARADSPSKTIVSDGEEVPVSTWPTQRPVRASRQVSEETKVQWELRSLRANQAKLEEEKQTGAREIDTIDEEIQQINEKIEHLESLLPRKKWFGLF